MESFIELNAPVIATLVECRQLQPPTGELSSGGHFPVVIDARAKSKPRCSLVKMGRLSRTGTRKSQKIFINLRLGKCQYLLFVIIK